MNLDGYSRVEKVWTSGGGVVGRKLKREGGEKEKYESGFIIYGMLSLHCLKEAKGNARRSETHV